MTTHGFVFGGETFDLPREYAQPAPLPLRSALGPAVIATARRPNELHPPDDDDDAAPGAARAVLVQHLPALGARSR